MKCPNCDTELRNDALACHVCATSFQPPRPPTRYAGFWRRVLAVFIDLALMAPAFFIAKDYFILPFSPEEQHALYEMLGDRLTAAEYQQVQLAFLLRIAEMIMILFAVMAPYYIAAESSAMQGTLGKWLLGLRVTDLDGRRIRLGRAAVRYFARPLSSQPLQFGFMLAGITPKKRALHDFIARTLVIVDNSVDSTVFCPDCGPFAGFWRRAAAFLLDLVILAPTLLVVGSYLERPPYPLHRSVWVSLVGAKFTYYERELLEKAITRRIIEAPVLFFFLSGVYFVATECSPLQGTVGKRILRLRVTDIEGRRIRPGGAIKRHFARSLSGLMWSVGFIMAAFTARKRAFHDLLADTLVVIRRKPAVEHHLGPLS